ncbi:DUF4147 domain-containing protein [Micromonospora sp. NPDC049580]|uniref:DUF4147 domain-containing protein n=1 Tax=Micromonospora sp. NPDC049580 TaxID=3154832 RepID=UPI003430D9D2
MCVSVAAACLPGLHATKLTATAIDREPFLHPGVRSVRSVTVGKAAHEMASAIVAASGTRFRGGICVSKSMGTPIPGVTQLVGDHPFPRGNSLTAGIQLRSFLTSGAYDQRDVIVFGISGGASALAVLPLPPVTLEDLTEVTRILVLSGVDVTTVNMVRRSVSAIHNGGLLSYSLGARCCSYILCDNVQVGPAGVGSGMTYPSVTDADAVVEIMQKAEIPSRLTANFVAAMELRRSRFAGHAECRNTMVGDPGLAVRLCAEEAARRGFRTDIIGSALQGSTQDVAALFARRLDLATRDGGPPPRVVLGGGEATVNVRGGGRGGRCQELAWRVARHISGSRSTCFVALATDGQDFVAEAMGAWVTGGSFGLLSDLGYSWERVLADNNTYEPLARMGQIIEAALTGTNVCDIYALFRW